ncbi:hypothetical protein [Aquimarina mytili]|uniref:Uncharacterized protein n=1 Tax=Aquimarina mytili TaxID=874423 RepID=A0A937A790_9FLAO|nr:hypothetical protein [Aquimarina mytili]MBL0686150.1 hypothetical protein [Aquimarina mytili]
MILDYSELLEKIISYLLTTTVIMCHFYTGPTIKNAIKNSLTTISDTIIYISKTREFRITSLIFIYTQFAIGTIAALFIGILAWLDAFSILNTILWFSLLFSANSFYCYQNYKLVNN